MGSELNGINSKSAKNGDSDLNDHDSSAKDDRPLLESAASSAAEDIQELEKKFAAFVRNDVYGSMGCGKLPLKEKLLLGVAIVTLLPLRLVLVMAILVVYYLICRIFTLFSTPNLEDEQEDFAHLTGCRRAVIVQSGRLLSRLLLFTIGFYWINETHKDSTNTQENSKIESTKQSEDQERAGAIVSNHLSYLDILYHMSSSFPSFVAKRSGHYHMPETRGLCLSEEQTISTILRRPSFGIGNRAMDMITEPFKLTRRCEVTAILILYGLPRLLTGSILAHEMMHAWMRLQGFQTLSQDVEEGICQVLAHMWLATQLDSSSPSSDVASTSSSSSSRLRKAKRPEFERKLGEFFKHQIESDTSPVYGDGFRAGHSAVYKFGLRRTLEHIQMTGSFPY